MKLTVQVPATTANLGPGFDCLGLALDLRNTVEVELSGDGLQITVVGEGADLIPRDATNLVYRAAASLFRAVGGPVPGLRIRLVNHIPLMSGLGSSSAAIVGGLVAANAIAGQPLSDADLLQLAVDLEGHPDNVAPALLGGLVIVALENTAPIYRRVPIVPLRVVVAVPEFRVATATARAALPEQVPLADAAFNIGRAALLVQALIDGDYALLRRAMEDRLHQPYRAALVPGFEAVVQAARDAGASGVALSGAGPCVVAFAPRHLDAIGGAMCHAFARHGLRARHTILDITSEGARLGEGAQNAAG
jgi:homoserine kinase